MYTNSNSVIGKMDELKRKFQSGNYDIVAITESWATEDINDGELKIDGYVTYRKDRTISNGGKGKGGGVLLYVRDTLQSCPLLNLTNDEFQDSVWCMIDSDSHSVVVGVCYRSTSSTKDNNASLLGLLEKAENQAAKSHLLIFGDFNYPEINYERYEVEGGPDTDAYRFFNKTTDLFLYQNINEWTRCRIGQQPSLLDYVFTDEDNVVEDIKFTTPLGKSDHVCIEMSYIWTQIENDISHHKHDYWKGDYDRIRDELRTVDWDKELGTKQIDEAWTYFRSRLTSLTQSHVPLKKPVGTKATQKNEWITKGTKKVIKKRDALWKKYREFTSERNYKAYKAVRNRVTKLIRADKISYQQKLARQFQSNPKRFYSYVRRTQTVKDKVMGLKKVGGEPTTTDQETATVFCDYFKDVFVTEDSWNVDLALPQDEDIEVEITEEKVKKLLKALKPDKSPGPDGIHPLLLRSVAEEVAKPLTLIFVKSFETGDLPHDWRQANITPIYKKGPKNEAGNYRPISLTSVVCKILERIIKENLTQFLERKGQITLKQHGFVNGRSCLTNLLEVFEKWTEYLDAGNGFDVVYLDYRKAFDTVPHRRLLTKIQQAGIGCKVLNWIEAFLQDREMRVVVNGQWSPWAPVTSGVPQGSVLGPLLFLIYVNDLPDWIRSEMRMFADDTKIWNKIADLGDCVKLQDDLDSLQRWSDKWLLQLNPEKCKVMHVGHNYRFPYTMKQDNNTYNLQVTDEERDLGIKVKNDLSVSPQCAEAAKKAMRVLGMVRRQFKDLDRECFIILYKTFVRPHMEFAIQAWSPYLKRDINCLEKVQRRATKLVKGLKKFSYENRLARLGLTSLADRRLRGDLIEAYKIITGKERVQMEDFFELSHTGYNLRGHRYKLAQGRSRLELRKNFFSQRVVGPWNRLPSHIVEATTVNAFKNRYDSVMRGAPLS
jgi:hypothetical protein